MSLLEFEIQIFVYKDQMWILFKQPSYFIKQNLYIASFVEGNTVVI